MPTPSEASEFSPPRSRIFISEAGPKTDPSLPVLVFLHGIAGSHEDFQYQIDFLSQWHRTIAFDLPGHGQSPAADASTITKLADIVEAELLDREISPGDWVPIGHSLGGLIALELGGRGRLAPKASVLIDAPMLIPESIAAGLARYEEGFRSASARDARETIREFAETYFFHPDDDPVRHAALLERLLSFPVKEFIRLSEAVNTYDAENAVRRCTAPPLYIQASVPADLARMVHLNPDFRTARTSRASHYAQLELPKEINRLIAAHLAQGAAASKATTD